MPGRDVRAWLRPLVLAALAAFAPAAARAQTGPWAATVFGGQMTDNAWQETLTPWRIDTVRSSLLGVALGYERSVGAAGFSVGAEAQIAGHFGRQDHIELNLPLTLRYRGDGWRGLDAIGFGLGLSHASAIPQVEIDRDGASQRTLAYWMIELEFDVPPRGLSAVLRLHHRSDAFGLFETDAGSNAVVVGLRRRF